MKITEALVAEHVTLRAFFRQIERVWPHITTRAEARLLASLLEGLLGQHGAREEKLLYVAYDHVLEDRGELQRLHQEHDEIDARLVLVHEARSVPAAKGLLREVLARSLRHFRFEERVVFPGIEKALQADTLERLAQSASLVGGGKALRF